MELRKIYIVAGIALIMLILAMGLIVLQQKAPPLVTNTKHLTQSTEELKEELIDAKFNNYLLSVLSKCEEQVRAGQGVNLTPEETLALGINRMSKNMSTVCLLVTEAYVKTSEQNQNFMNTFSALFITVCVTLAFYLFTRYLEYKERQAQRDYSVDHRRVALMEEELTLLREQLGALQSEHQESEVRKEEHTESVRQGLSQVIAQKVPRFD